MDALQMLKKDHETVSKLFERFEKLGDKGAKQKATIVQKIVDELTIHAEIEESVFYPTVREADPDVILESFEEHAIVKNLVEQLRDLTPEDETFKAKVMVLCDIVEHHVEEEEKDLFKKVKKTMGKAELEELGKQLAKAKREAKKLVAAGYQGERGREAA